MSPASVLVASQIRDAAPLFAALGDETRLRLVTRLAANGPESQTNLSARFSMTRQAIAKHLHVLSEAGLIVGERQGREHLWQVDPQRFATAQGYLQRISQQWDDALARLKELVERE